MKDAEILEVKEDRSFKETFFRKDGKVYSKLEASFGSVMLSESVYYESAKVGERINKKVANYIASIVGKPMYDFKNSRQYPRELEVTKEEMEHLEKASPSFKSNRTYLGVTIICNQ